MLVGGSHLLPGYRLHLLEAPNRPLGSCVWLHDPGVIECDIAWVQVGAGLFRELNYFQEAENIEEFRKAHEFQVGGSLGLSAGTFVPLPLLLSSGAAFLLP